MIQPQPDPTAEAILDRALAGVEEAKQRCEEAAEHLRNREHLAAIGALAGLDERVRYVSIILTLLHDIQPTLIQSQIDFN